jgi:hypothetical protein
VARNGAGDAGGSTAGSTAGGEWTVATLRQWVIDQLATQRDLISVLSVERARFLDERSERIDDRFTAERRAVEAALAATQREADAKFIALEKQLLAALASAERAANILETQSKEWRSSANEWRGAMQDRDRLLVPRDTFDTALAARDKQLSDLNDRLTRAEGAKKGAGDLVGWIFGAVGLLAAIVVVANAIYGG